MRRLLIAPLKRPRKSRAQGLVEFALILPVLLLVVFVIVELARVLHAWMAIENGARFGVRYAVTGEFDEGTYCGGSCAESAEEAARIDSIKDAAQIGAVAILKNDTVPTIDLPGFFKVTVCSSNGGVTYTPGDPNGPPINPLGPFASKCEPSEHAGEPGETVIVTIDFTHPLITPMLSTVWPDLNLRAQRTGIVEQYRTSRVRGIPVQHFATPATSTPTFTPVPTDTPVPTPTPSNTPTPTPTPSCANIFLYNRGGGRPNPRLNGDDFEVYLRNDNAASAYLSSAYLVWDDSMKDNWGRDMRVDKFMFDGNTYHRDWPYEGDNDYDYTSPSESNNSWEEFSGNGNVDKWEVDFNRAPSPLWGEYSVDLIFGFEDMALTCPVSGYLDWEQQPTSTPRPANTSGPSRTPTKTKTPGPSRTPRPPTATDPPATDTPAVTATTDWGDG